VRVRVGVLVVAVLAVPLLPAVAARVIPAPGVPVLNSETPRGTGTLTPLPAVAPSAKVVDGGIADWTGTPTRYGGTIVRSAGELIYQDHLFDSYGADGGDDAERLASLDQLTGPVPDAYRLEQVIKQDLAGELGVPAPPDLRGYESYGDADTDGDGEPDLVDNADLLEARVAVDAGSVVLLARTTTMTAPDQTAVLVLADRGGEPAGRDVPFGSGLHTEQADVALLLAGSQGWVADLASGDVTALAPGSVATDAAGWNNAVEARVPLDVLGDAQHLRLALGTGSYDGAGGLADLGAGARVANIAFRTAEPVRVRFDKQQALALLDGTMDPFLLDIDPAALAAGANERWDPGPGYHERQFTSSEAISGESGENGVTQHYGVYLPASYEPGTATPLQWWLHWRGGKAHSAGAVIPGMFEDLGEAQDTIVVSPRGRGSSSWYVGRGQVDIEEVWADVLATFSIDEDRVYVTGHSMGGWGSYLLSVLHPDRFAAAFPVSGPVTQGAWTGADFDGCDEISDGEYSPCYISANDGRPRDQHTRRMLENLRGVPVAIFQGAADELVPVSGVTRQAEELARLGYRYRYYLFPNYEHYSHPIVDEWAEGGRYLHSFRRVKNPKRVTYRRDMPFERAVEEVQAEDLGLDFTFDHAYWMSELTPADPEAGVARFNGASLAIPAHLGAAVPEAGGPASPGQTGPYAMTGLGRLGLPVAGAATSNGFEAELSGATAVRLDLTRMRVRTDRAVQGTITTDTPLELRLAAAWPAAPTVSVNGQSVGTTLAGGVLSVPLPKGVSKLVVR
jgi:pimeloyl-ACP methyl ester carboxylesterase